MPAHESAMVDQDVFQESEGHATNTKIEGGSSKSG